MRFVFLISLTFYSLFSLAATYYPNGNGSFGSTSTWQGSTVGVPGASDNVTFSYSRTIPVTNKITLNGNYTMGNLDFSNCSAQYMEFSSADGLPHTLTINNLSMESDFTLVIKSNITLVVNGTTNTNGGWLQVESGGKINFKNDVTLAGAGAKVDISSGGLVDITGKLTFSGGANILNIAGTLSMDNMEASGGQQELNILAGGVVTVRNNSTFSGSADFNIKNAGTFTVKNNMTVSGGAKGVIDGSLTVTGVLNNSVAITGTTGTVTAGDYQGTGSIFGTAMTSLLDGKTYAKGATGAVEVTPMPVKLVYFQASGNSGSVILLWQTASEENNDFFIIERSNSDQHFTPIAQIDGAGNSDMLIDYSYTDNCQSFGPIYYRLKQTDFDGKTTYSRTVVINQKNELAIICRDNEIVLGLGTYEGQANMMVYNISGQLVYENSFSAEPNEQIKLPFQAPSGIYFLSITQNGSLLTNSRFYKN